MEADLKNLADNPQTTLLEGLHSVAYTGGLGRPLIVPDGCLGGLNAGACQGGCVGVGGTHGLYGWCAAGAASHWGRGQSYPCCWPSSGPWQ